MRVFIVGSGPFARAPEVTPDVIIAANGALSRVQSYANKSKLILFLSSHVLCSMVKHAEATRKALNNSFATTVFIVDSSRVVRDLSTKDIGIACEDVRIISHNYQTECLIRQLGHKTVLKGCIKLSSRLMVVRSIINMITNKLIKPLKLSTGLFALLHAINKYGFFASYYVIGISFQPDSGHFYDSNKKFGSRHLNADIFYVKQLVNKYPFLSLTFDNKEFHLFKNKRYYEFAPGSN